MLIFSLITHQKIKYLTWSLHSRVWSDYRNTWAHLIFQSKLGNIVITEAGCLTKQKLRKMGMS